MNGPKPMSTDPSPPDPTRPPTNPTSRPTVPTVPPRSPPYAPTVGKFINLLAAWVGNVLFWLSVIFAVGWMIVGCTFFMALEANITDPVMSIAFVVPFIFVGIGWALRYFLTR